MATPPADARRSIREKGHIVLTKPGHAAHWNLAASHALDAAVRKPSIHCFSTNCTLIAAFSAATCATCCAGFAASRVSTAAIRNLFAAPQPSPNPGELASRLLETEVEVLNSNGAPAAEKTFVFYNPPVVNRALGIRRSYINESFARGAGIPENAICKRSSSRTRACIRNSSHLFATGKSAVAGKAGNHSRLSWRLFAE